MKAHPTPGDEGEPLKLSQSTPLTIRPGLDGLETRAACYAMATRFECVVCGEEPVRARAAAEEALQEIQRLDARLSRFHPGSEIFRINQAAAKEPVRIDFEVFSLLSRCRKLSEETDGAFDIACGPGIQLWREALGQGQPPSPAQLLDAREHSGWRHILLDENRTTIQFDRPGLFLDLGSVGKGFAIDCAMARLQEAGISRALIHGGTSSVGAIGMPTHETPWRVALANSPPPEGDAAEPAQDHETGAIDLRDESFSASATWGRARSERTPAWGHVIDPRTLKPVEGLKLAAVALKSAAEADAWSTALLVLGDEGKARFTELFPAGRTWMRQWDAAH